jgi:cell division protein FtsQ
MAIISKYTFNKILVIMGWIVLISGTVVLLVAAITKRNNERVSSININISGVENNFFIDKKDVIAIIEKTNGGVLEKKPLHSVDLASMENDLQKTQWIRRAELYFDNNNVLQVRIMEREPIARIFSTTGASFYIDSSLTMLPLSDKFSARLPVFTDFPTDAKVLSKEDSNLLSEIRTLGEFIGGNAFWMAQIDQVDITSENDFDLIPKLGTQVIHFGNADNYQEKFDNLLCFYKQVLTKLGWTHYSSISVQFQGQVVGVRRGANEIKMDSLRSIQIMKDLIADAQKHTNDSTTIQLQQPDEDNSSINSSDEPEKKATKATKKDKNIIKDFAPVGSIHLPLKTTTNNPVSTKSKPLTDHSSSIGKPGPAPLKTKVNKPPDLKSEEKIVKTPKAVMPSKTDY